MFINDLAGEPVDVLIPVVLQLLNLVQMAEGGTHYIWISHLFHGSGSAGPTSLYWWMISTLMYSCCKRSPPTNH